MLFQVDRPIQKNKVEKKISQDFNKSVLLVGDSGEDVWQYGHCKKSPEAPVMVFKPTHFKKNPGLGANVFYNIKSLNNNIDINFICQDKEITKTRYVDEDSGAQIMRLDHEGKSEPLTIDKVAGVNKYDCVVISDYNKGLVDENLISELSKLNEFTFLDTKKVLNFYSSKVFCVKINLEELNNNLKYHECIEEMGQYCKYLLVTRGRHGMSLYKYGALTCEIENEPVQVHCVSGAGDSVLAAIVVKFLETGKLNKETLEFASRVAKFAVSQPGVVAVKRSEI